MYQKEIISPVQVRVLKRATKEAKMAEREFVHVSEAYTQIGDRRYDLIRVDFGREHPEPALVRMRKFDPEGLVVRTGEHAAEFLINYVDRHLQVCDDGCNEIVNEEFKTY